jgi:hypothetical protein
MMDGKFCLSCQCFRHKDLMKCVTVGKKRMWRCVFCIERRAKTKYSSKPKEKEDHGTAV